MRRSQHEDRGGETPRGESSVMLRRLTYSQGALVERWLDAR
jgi:hypothetical protein